MPKKGKGTVGPLATTETLADRLTQLAKDAQALTVTRETYDAAIVKGRDLKRALKEWEEHEKPVVDKTKEAYDLARDRYNQIYKPLKAAFDALKLACGKCKLEMEADYRRQQNEALKAQEEEIRRQAEEQAQRTDTFRHAAHARQDMRIADAIGSGDLERASLLMEQRDLNMVPFAPPPPPPPPRPPAFMPPPTNDGLSAKEEYDFEVFDEHAVPREFCEPSDKKIKERVKLLGAQAYIPGVRVFLKPRVRFS